jgi:iron complex outermembrane receptor protein
LFNGQQLLRHFSLNYCYISQEQREEEGVQSKYALEYLRHKLTATLQMKLWKALHLALYYRVQDRTGTYTDTNGNVRNYAGYGVVDGRLTWEKPRYQIHVAVNNLFGKQYVDYGNVPQPGTWVMGGIRISLP